MGLLELLIIVLVILWLGGVGTYGLMAGGGLIHLLLVVLIVVILIRLLRGERV